MCGLSGVQKATLLLVELLKIVSSVFIFVPRDVDCCCAVGLRLSVYKAWGRSDGFSSIL